MRFAMLAIRRQCPVAHKPLEKKSETDYRLEAGRRSLALQAIASATSCIECSRR
jgi:hypothetical protein